MQCISAISVQYTEELTSLTENSWVSLPPASSSLISALLSKNLRVSFVFQPTGRPAGRSGSRPPTACSCCREYKVQSECIHHRLSLRLVFSRYIRSSGSGRKLRPSCQRHFEPVTLQFSPLTPNDCLPTSSLVTPPPLKCSTPEPPRDESSVPSSSHCTPMTHR